MRARHVTVRGSGIDGGLKSLRERVIPILKECRGFRGEVVLVDREKGEIIGISFWDTEEDMLASEEKLTRARQETADSAGASAAPEVRMLELPIYEPA
jgi:heme-degrading monooxygenase HmoA